MVYMLLLLHGKRGCSMLSDGNVECKIGLDIYIYTRYYIAVLTKQNVGGGGGEAFRSVSAWKKNTDARG